MRPIPAIALMFIGLLDGTADAAPCDAATVLARLYDSIVALEKETGDQRQNAATLLMAIIIPDANAPEIARELAEVGVNIDPGRLRALLKATATRAREIAGDPGAEPYDATSPAATGLDWFGDVILATNCVTEWDGLDPLQEPDKWIDIELSEDPMQTVSRYSRELGLLASILCGASAVMALRRTRVFRMRELRFQPRSPVALTASVRSRSNRNKTAEATRVRIMDLSIGGAKVAWKDPPPTGTQLDLEVSDRVLSCSVVWRNDYYAGLLFDSTLTKSALDGFLDLNSGRSAGK